MAQSELLSEYSDEKLSDIPPSNILHYLKINGWIKVENAPYNIDLYRHSRHEVEIFVPKSNTGFDYINDLLNIVKKLSNVEYRTPKEIIEDIISDSPSDIIRIGFVGYNDEKGTIPVDDCVKFYTSVRDSINIIGKDIIDRDQFGRYEVSDFINSCLVGQTEYGSYITPIICPLLIHSSKQADLSFFDHSQEIENLVTRKITKTFINSINHMVSCINEDKQEQLLDFDKNDFTDVSSNSNFYRVLSTIGLSNIRNMNIDIKWGVKDPSGVPHHLSVERKHFEAIMKLIHPLSEKTINEEKITTTYSGSFYSLQTQRKIKKPRRVKKGDGSVGFEFVADDGNPYEMSFSLSGEDYETACDAIKNHLNVYVKGVFKRKIEDEIIKYSLIKLEKISIVTNKKSGKYDDHQVIQKKLIDSFSNNDNSDLLQ
jgi:hypothetical protein